MLWIALLALAQSNDELPPWVELRWLARHQNENGSFGGRPKECTCPRDPAPASSKADPARVRELLSQLKDRGEATRELELLGKSIVPQLKDALEGAADDDVRSKIRQVLSRLDYVERNEYEISALAAQAFLWFDLAPKSPLIQPRERLLAYLAKQELPDGTDVTLAEAETAVAFLMAWKLHELNDYEKHATRFREALRKRQRASGAWGPGRDDPLTTLQVMFSIGDSAERQKGLSYLKSAAKGGELLEKTVWATAELEFGQEDVMSLQEEFAKIGPTNMNGPERQLAGNVLFHRSIFISPQLERWKTWYKDHKDLLLVFETADGCMHGSISAKGQRAWNTAWFARESTLLHRRW